MLLASRYRLTEILGRGGMGEVFHGYDELLGRPVAVKLLLPGGPDPYAAARFRREARTAAKVKDPHVVAAYDFGQQDGTYYLVMELVEGLSVADELASHGPLEPERAVDIVRQTAAGLAAAHRRDIVHRDIKPANLLIDADGTVKVADFGIARVLADRDTAVTTTGQILGTSHYLAPERALGKPATAASDVYALGCVLYQLVTGCPPFLGDDPASILRQHVDTPPTPPGYLRPDLAEPIEDLILRMLAKDPTRRPTAAEIADSPWRDLPVLDEPTYADEAGSDAVASTGVSAQTTMALDLLRRNHWRRAVLVMSGVLASIRRTDRRRRHSHPSSTTLTNTVPLPPRLHHLRPSELHHRHPARR